MAFEYGDKKYWDERYTSSNEMFDWYQKYETVKPFISEILNEKEQTCRVLHIGCGNSEFGYVR